MPYKVVKILETDFFKNGANLRKLIHKSRLTEYPEKMKPYLLILENSGLIAYHKTDGVYRTTYKGMHFLRTYNHTFDLLSNFENSQEMKV
jgi:predicted transcriptional regulator